ncbi:MAG: DUF4342 domain-containing protein [Erysipelotrichaceae bacterium]|jgi:hypothetical protein|nr:DUF4342 domain-containing protein [Erysipelotrichaceae bacterium]
MNFTINDVDQVIARTNCTYEEAKEALIEADGVVIDAIIYLENKNRPGSFFRSFMENSERTSETISEKISQAIKEGKANRLEVRDSSGKTLTSVSLNTGAAIGFLTLVTQTAPLALVSALVAKYGLGCRFILIRRDGSEVNL